MFPWAQIDAVLLDMDGTLLDLHFDNHFWQTLVPQTLSKQRGISTAQAAEMVTQAYQRVEGTLNWYCLDYWANELQLDIMALHHCIVASLIKSACAKIPCPFYKPSKPQVNVGFY